MGHRQPRLLDQIRDRIRRKHYSIRAYVDWMWRFVLHHNKRHPRDIGAAEAEAFLSPPRGSGAGVGLDAEPGQECGPVLLFLYKEVLGEPLPWVEGIESAKRPERLPVVLTREEVESILTHLSGTVGLVIRLLYGTGIRIMECVRIIQFWRSFSALTSCHVGIDRACKRRQRKSKSGFCRIISVVSSSWRGSWPRTSLRKRKNEV